MEALQLPFGGLANGCTCGRAAPGFVRICKATEGVTFARGDMRLLAAGSPVPARSSAILLPCS